MIISIVKETDSEKGLWGHMQACWQNNLETSGTLERWKNFAYDVKGCEMIENILRNAKWIQLKWKTWLCMALFVCGQIMCQFMENVEMICHIKPSLCHSNEVHSFCLFLLLPPHGQSKFKHLVQVRDARYWIFADIRYADIFSAHFGRYRYRYISFCLETTPSLSCAEIISKIFLILVSF